MKKYIWICLTIFIGFSSNLMAQIITIGEYLKMVQKSHNLSEQVEQSVLNEKLGQKKIAGNQDWVISSEPFVSYEKPASIDPFSGESITSAGLTGKLEKTFWSNGGRLSLNWRYNFLNQNLPASAKAFQIPENNFQNIFSANYMLPLWQNRGGMLNRLEFDLKEFDINLAKIRTLEQNEDFLATSAASFLEWVMLDEQFKIARNELEINKEQNEQTQRKYKAHLVNQTDLLGAKNALMMSEQTVQLLEGRWLAQQKYLAELAGNSEIENRAPDYNILQPRHILSDAEIKNKIKQNSRILKEMNIRKNQLKVVNGGLKENLKPQLYLNLGAGVQKSVILFGKSIVPNRPTLSAGVVFEMPLGNSAAKAGVEQNTVALKQLELSIHSTKLNLLAQAAQLSEQLKSIQKILALNQAQISNAAEKTKEELKVYNQGRTTLNFVLLSRTEEQNARLNYIENAINYHILNWQLKAQLDELLPEGE